MSHGHEPDKGPAIYAMVAEFEDEVQLIAAAERTRKAGYKDLDAYAPFPVHGLSEAIGFRDGRVPWLILIGGMLGGLGGYTLQWYTAVVDLPLNVGGKPLNSLPAFFPITFESTILCGAFTAFFSVLILNRLPKPYHSIFNTPGFERASQDRFFLEVGVEDPLYDSKETRHFLEALKPINVSEVLA
jgi:hypothetical protein